MASKYHHPVYNGASFEGSAARRHDPLPGDRERARRQSEKSVLDPMAVICLVLAFCMILLMLFTYVRVYESNTKCSELESKLTALQEERNLLKSRYESMLDLRAIEQDAIERLGMTKPFGGQTVYVNLSGTDRGEVLDAKSSALEDAAQMFREAFAALGAYLSD